VRRKTELSWDERIDVGCDFAEVSRSRTLPKGLAAPQVIGIIKRMLSSDLNYWLGPPDDLLLYSGPADQTGPVTNQQRALKQAAQSGAMMLDKTPIGQFLDNVRPGQNIYDYFLTSGMSRDMALHSADQVMGYVSWQFLDRANGKISTAVCGTSLMRYFWKYEMKHLLERPYPAGDVKSVNEIPMETLRDMYDDIYERYINKNWTLGDIKLKPPPSETKKHEDVLRMVCIGELRMAVERVTQSNSIEDYQNFVQRFALYQPLSLKKKLEDEVQKAQDEQDGAEIGISKAELYMYKLESMLYASKEFLDKKFGQGIACKVNSREKMESSSLTHAPNVAIPEAVI
jgi:hypothetical protein